MSEILFLNLNLTVLLKTYKDPLVARLLRVKSEQTNLPKVITRVEEILLLLALDFSGLNETALLIGSDCWPVTIYVELGFTCSQEWLEWKLP